MDCRPGCGACCVAISISSPIPGMPGGKPAGVRCVQLTGDNLCRLFGDPSRPAVCARFQASPETCGETAEEALALGLVNRIVPKDELESQALRWAEELAQKSPIAVQIAKSAFYQSEDMSYADQFAFMNEAFARLCSTRDAKEGVRAFFEKRVPVWQEK